MQTMKMIERFLQIHQLMPNLCRIVWNIMQKALVRTQ